MKPGLVFRAAVICLVLQVSSQASISAQDQAIVNTFLYRSHTASNVTLPYRLFVPKNMIASERYPLVVTLHGAGEVGNNNTNQVNAHPIAAIWARDSNQAKQKCFVASPQAPSWDQRWCDFPSGITGTYSTDKISENNQMRCVKAIIDSLRRAYPIDSNRIYICGMSMGGFGTFDAILRYPTLFAAAAVMCGGGDSATLKLSSIKDVSLWFFHSNNDGTVPPSCSRILIAALQKLGRKLAITNCVPGTGTCPNLSGPQMDSLMKTNPTFISSEYTGGDHEGGWRDVSTSTIKGRGCDNPFFVAWMLSQKRPLAATPVRADGLLHNKSVPANNAKAVMYGSNGIVLPDELRGSFFAVYSLTGQLVGNAFVGKNGTVSIRASHTFGKGGVVVLRPVQTEPAIDTKKP